MISLPFIQNTQLYSESVPSISIEEFSFPIQFIFTYICIDIIIHIILEYIHEYLSIYPCEYITPPPGKLLTIGTYFSFINYDGELHTFLDNDSEVKENLLDIIPAADS